MNEATQRREPTNEGGQPKYETSEFIERVMTSTKNRNSLSGGNILRKPAGGKNALRGSAIQGGQKIKKIRKLSTISFNHENYLTKATNLYIQSFSQVTTEIFPTKRYMLTW